jgi:phosphomannomutase
MAGYFDIKFGTDGWRGVTAWDFTFGSVKKLAQAIADYMCSSGHTLHEGHKRNAYVGYDTRFLSKEFAKTIAQVLKINGVEVTLSPEPLTTPYVSFLTQKKFWVGIFVTASHNSWEYNGIKIKINGHSAPESITDEIESFLKKNAPIIPKNTTVSEKSFEDAYVSLLKKSVNLKNIAVKLKGSVLFDCMYGSSALVAKKIFSGKKFEFIHDNIDHLFGLTQPEPIEQNLGELIGQIKSKKHVAGIAFDGDADRMGVIDDKGIFVTPYQIFLLFLHYLITAKKLKGKVVQTVSMGYLAKRIAREHNLSLEEVPVGFKYISEKALEKDFLAGAGESGGYTWKGAPPERDGILSALMLLEILAKNGKKLSELIANLEKTYGKSVFSRTDFPLNKEISDKAAFTEKIKKKLPKKILGMPISESTAIDGIKIILKNDEWILIRPSGTEPLLRIYAESETQQRTKDLLEYAKKLVSTYV